MAFNTFLLRFPFSVLLLYPSIKCWSSPISSFTPLLTLFFSSSCSFQVSSDTQGGGTTTGFSDTVSPHSLLPSTSRFAFKLWKHWIKRQVAWVPVLSITSYTPSLLSFTIINKIPVLPIPRIGWKLKRVNVVEPLCKLFIGCCFCYQDC